MTVRVERSRLGVVIVAVVAGSVLLCSPSGGVVPVGQPPVTAVDGTPAPPAPPTPPSPTPSPPTPPTPSSNTIPVSGVVSVNEPVTTLAPSTIVAPIQAGSGPTSTVVSSSMVLPTSVPASGTPASTTPTPKQLVGPRNAEELRAAVLSALALSTSKSRSVFVVLDDTDTVVDLEADAARTPASTQKVYVAGAVLAKLGGDHRYVTEVRSSTIVAGGAADELVLRASGDPSFSSSQLGALADAVVKAGVQRAPKGLVLDDAHFDNKTRLDIWKRSFTPGEVGVLSSFTIDGNHRSDAETSADPGMANLKRFRAALVARGVTVGSGMRRGELLDGGPVVASVQSAPLRDLVRTMLKKSDNTYAEMFTKELGARNGNGSTSGGVAAISAYMVQLGVAAPVAQVDGSGLSSSNRSTARQQVDFLRRTSTASYAADFLDGLPVACVDGTMRNRLCQTSGARSVRAKTGGIDFVVGLAGFGQTSTGTRVTFSFLLNEVRSSSSARASIDKALAAISSSTL